MSTPSSAALPPGEVIPARDVPHPPRTAIPGKRVSLEPLDASRHKASLFTNIGGPSNAGLWTYIPDHPPTDTEADFDLLAAHFSVAPEFQFYAVTRGDEALGIAAYLSVSPEHRRLEIGAIIFGPALQRTREATEALYLLISRAFELGYHRVEWKANSFNKPSLAAAERLGFVYEGKFRKHLITKGRRRDTEWFSIIDDEWPAVKAGFEAWLDDANFDTNGKQKRGLRECRESAGSA